MSKHYGRHHLTALVTMWLCARTCASSGFYPCTLCAQWKIGEGEFWWSCRSKLPPIFTGQTVNKTFLLKGKSPKWKGKLESEIVGTSAQNLGEVAPDFWFLIWGDRSHCMLQQPMTNRLPTPSSSKIKLCQLSSVQLRRCKRALTLYYWTL